MEMNWDLSVFYMGFDDPAFVADMEKLRTLSADGMAILAKKEAADAKLKKLVSHLEIYINVLRKVGMFCQLTMSVNAEDRTAFQNLELESALEVDFQVFLSAARRYIGTVENLEAVIDHDPELKKNGFALLEAREQAAHMLDEGIERWMLRMSLSGGDSFSKLRDQLIGTLTVEMDGQSHPLPYIRGLAFDPDPAVRKKAYEAEIASYKKVALPMAFCLAASRARRSRCAKPGITPISSPSSSSRRAWTGRRSTPCGRPCANPSRILGGT